MAKKELLDKAKELEIEVKDENISDDDLTKQIEEEEKKDKKFWKAEAKAAFADRDKAKKERATLSNQIKEMEAQIKDMPKGDELTALKKELQDLKDHKATVDKEKEDLELSKKSDLEKAEFSFNKKFETFKKEMEDNLNGTKKATEDLQKKLADKDGVISNLRKSKLRSELMESAIKYDAFNPSQIVNMLEYKFEYSENLDKFSSNIYDNNGKLKDMKEVEDVVKEFLSDPKNENLVKSKIKVGGPDLKKGGDDSSDKNKKLSKSTPGTYDPKDPDLIREATMKGLEVEDLIETKKLRDAKLHPKKE